MAGRHGATSVLNSGSHVQRKRLQVAATEAMNNALRYYRTVPCFEGKFKEELGFLLPTARVEREAPSQWKVVFEDAVVFVSLRAVCEASLLQDLRSNARAVRRVLLGEKAAWLRALSKDDADDFEYERFLNEVRDACGQETQGCRESLANKGDLCEKCGKSLLTDRLGGRHHCRMIASFACAECGKKWKTQRARFDVREGRLLDQYCEGCGEAAEVIRMVPLSDHELAKLQQERDAREARQARSCCSGPKNGYYPTAREYENQEPIAAKAELSAHDDKTEMYIRTDFHRPEFCEGCRRYGDCSGAFMDPFVLFAAARLLQEESLMEEAFDLEWETLEDGGLNLVGGLGDIHLVPHIYAPSSSSSSSGSNQTLDTQDYEAVYNHFH